MLAWTLKAAESCGCDAAEAVTSASQEPDTVSALLTLTRTVARNQQASLPPWISKPATSPAGCPDAGRQVVTYLEAAADEIRKRVRALTVDATHSLPAWVNALGALTSDHARRQEWLHHVGVVAAYRDQYQVTSDDPRQVLGPYAEPGHAGHRAYWHAAESVLAARTIAGLERSDVTRNEVGAQLTADLYLGLPSVERAAISAAMAERLGLLWFGSHSEADDDAATRSMYAPQLAVALIERGHLTQQMAMKVSMAGASAAIVAAGETPVEANYARRHAVQQTAQADAWHGDPRHSIRGEDVARPPQSISSRRRVAGPVEQGNDATPPPLPPSLENWNRGSTPLQ